MEVSRGLVDAHAKRFGGFFNSSLDASGYAGRDFFVLFGGNLTSGFNSLEAIELTGRVLKRSENNFYQTLLEVLPQ